MLGVSSLLVITGLSVSAIVRSQVRQTAARAHAARAGSAAQSAIELAGDFFRTYPDWRNSFGNSGSIPGITFGDARASLVMIDEEDGLLWNNDARPVRVFATAVSGDAQRICSQIFDPQERVPTPALAAAIIADKTITVNSGATLTCVNGPMISNTGIVTNLLSQTNADLAAPGMLLLGGVSGSTKAGVAQTPLPGSNAWSTLSARATTIPYSSIGGDKLDNCVLSAGQNPFGSANADGIYRIDVPAGKNFEIKRCRIDATLLVFLNTGAELKLKEKISWDGRAGGLALLVKADPATSAVILQNTTEPVSEKDISKNFNPPGVPYLGSTDADETDFYPVGVRGVVHVSGRGPVTLDDDFVLSGCLIVESTLTVSGDTKVHADPALMTSPPLGYEGPMLLAPRPGSFRWEIEAGRDAVIANAETLAGSATPPSGRNPSAIAPLVSVTVDGLTFR